MTGFEYVTVEVVHTKKSKKTYSEETLVTQ